MCNNKAFSLTAENEKTSRIENQAKWASSYFREVGEMNELAAAFFKSWRPDINNFQGLEDGTGRAPLQRGWVHTLLSTLGMKWRKDAGTPGFWKYQVSHYHSRSLALISQNIIFPPGFMSSDEVGGGGGSKYTFLLPEPRIREGAY